MPSFKLTVGSTDIENDQAVSISNVRPENNISSLVFQIDDYRSKNYSDLFDVFTEVSLALKCEQPTYTTVFTGKVSNLHVEAGMRGGETLTVTCWGYEKALELTHNSTSYGTLSSNPTIDTPKEIVQDMIDNYINKAFTGDSTNWGLDKTDVEDAHSALSVVTLNSPYLSNFTLLQRLCEIVNAYAQTKAPAEVGVHWYVDTDKHLRVKKIDADSTDTSWTRYWKSTAALSTLVQGNDIISWDLQKTVEEYANKIELYCSKFMMPALRDFITEDGGPVWGDVNCTYSYSNAITARVGSHSLLFTPSGAPLEIYGFYPSTLDAAWDFTKLGSKTTIPYINFWWYGSHDTTKNMEILLVEDYTALGGAADKYFYCRPSEYISKEADPTADVWTAASFPVGSYYEYAQEPMLTLVSNYPFAWEESVAAPNWGNINAVCFEYTAADVNRLLYIDDLWFGGPIIREAYYSGENTATRKERQKFLRLDTEIDDTLNTTTNTGTAARLAASELFRRALTPVVGKVQLAMKETILPGQTVHLHCGQKRDGSTYRFDDNYRCTRVEHQVSVQGYKTVLTVTDDETNSFTVGSIENWQIMQEQALSLSGGEARQFKSSGVDNLISRLSKDYT